MCGDGKAAYREADSLAEHPLYPEEPKKKKPKKQTNEGDKFIRENFR